MRQVNCIFLVGTGGCRSFIDAAQGFWLALKYSFELQVSCFLRAAFCRLYPYQLQVALLQLSRDSFLRAGLSSEHAQAWHQNDLG